MIFYHPFGIFYRKYAVLLNPLVNLFFEKKKHTVGRFAMGNKFAWSELIKKAFGDFKIRNKLRTIENFFVIDVILMDQLFDFVQFLL